MTVYTNAVSHARIMPTHSRFHWSVKSATARDRREDAEVVQRTYMKINAEEET